MRKAKYKITGPFGLIPIDTIIQCFILNECNNEFLVYHPPYTKYKIGENGYTDEGTGCFEICTYSIEQECLVSSKNNYCNLGVVDWALFESLSYIQRVYK